MTWKIFTIPAFVFTCAYPMTMILPIHNAGAVEPLSTEELSLHCMHYSEDPGGKDAVFCIRYIQGFIDGAVATDARVTINAAEEDKQQETYSERAFRTRVGRPVESYGPRFYAELCLGTPVPLKDVVNRVITALMDHEIAAAQPLAGSMVYQALRDAYPCVESADE